MYFFMCLSLCVVFACEERALVEYFELEEKVFSQMSAERTVDFVVALLRTSKRAYVYTYIYGVSL